MSTPFFKMSGSGNDFVVLDGRVSPPEAWPLERIVAVCDRRHGVGADGLVILTPEGPNAVRMTFYNADGSRAAMCGNAALCSTRLSARLGLAAPEGMELVTDAATYSTRSVAQTDRAEVRLADVGMPRPVEGIETARERRPGRVDRELMRGPGNLATALGITGVHTAHPLDRPPLWLAAGRAVPDAEVSIGPRIGIHPDRAADWPQRYWLARSLWVSKRA